MGRSVTPKYRMEVKTNVGYFTPSIWRGRATEQRLEVAVHAENKSFLPGGVNAHVANNLGAVPYIYKAKIINQMTGEVVAEYNAPAFQAF